MRRENITSQPVHCAALSHLGGRHKMANAGSEKSTAFARSLVTPWPISASATISCKAEATMVLESDPRDW